MRSNEERESLIEQKISEILSSNVPPQPKVKTNDVTCHSTKLQNLMSENRLTCSDIDYFYVDCLGLDKNTCKSGYLLRDWSTIPGRDKSPVRTVQKPSQQVEVSSDSRCLSPDLFESEDELDEELLKNINIKDSQSNNQENMSIKADSVETIIDLTGQEDGIGSSSSTKPASFYSLDEFELDYCGNGINEIENQREDNIKQLTIPAEFKLDQSGHSDTKNHGNFQKCDGKSINSEINQVEYNMDEPKTTDFMSISLRDGFLENEFMIEDHCMLDDNLSSLDKSKNENEIVKPGCIMSEAPVDDVKESVSVNNSQDMNKGQSQFASEIHSKNLDCRRDLLKTESPVCIELSDDSSMDSISKMVSQSLSELEHFSPNSSPKRKFNDNKVSFDFSPNSTLKASYFNSSDNFQEDFVKNDLTVNYEFDSAENEIKDTDKQYKKTENAELTHKALITDDFNDSLSPLMECNESVKKTDFQTLMIKQCADNESVTRSFVVDNIKDSSFILKKSYMDSSDLKDTNAVSQKVRLEDDDKGALCIEISDDSSTDENNVDFQSNLYPTTPKATNFSTISGNLSNKKSLNINSAELNITDYVKKMLNKENYTFDDDAFELKLSQESQSSQIDDEELNYSCHFNNPVEMEKSPSPQHREAATPDNYVIKTRNVTPMPDFDSMSTPSINRELEKVGVKALKRSRGAQLLKYIYESTHPLVGCVDVAESDDEEKVIKRRKRSRTEGRIEMEDFGRIEILGDRLLQQYVFPNS